MDWLFKFIELNNEYVKVKYIIDGRPSDEFDGEFTYNFKTKEMEIIKKSANDPKGGKALFLAERIVKYINLEKKEHKEYYHIAMG